MTKAKSVKDVPVITKKPKPEAKPKKGKAVPEKDSHDFMVQEPDKEVLKNLSVMGEQLKKLRVTMEKYGDAHKAAKAEYEHYATQVLPMEMFKVGASKIELMSGGTMVYKREFYCQPNKNEPDKRKIAKWLKKHGGEHLITFRCAVDGSQGTQAALKNAKIPFVEICDFNTNSIKSFTVDLLGAKGGKVRIKAEDIPKEMHFSELGIVDIKL